MSQLPTYTNDGSRSDTPLALSSSAGLGPHAQEWAMHIAAQCWCEPTTSMIEMDSRLALVFAAKLAAERERLANACEARQRIHEAEAAQGDGYEVHHDIALGCEECVTEIRGPNVQVTW